MSMKFNGYSPLDYKVVHQNGSFVREQYWFSGWIGDLRQYGSLKFISDGYTGRETILTVERVMPVRTLDIIEERASMAA